MNSSKPRWVGTRSGKSAILSAFAQRQHLHSDFHKIWRRRLPNSNGCYYVSSSRSPLDSCEQQSYCLSNHRTTSCGICMRSIVAPTWKFKCLFQVLNILVIYHIFISFTRNISKEIIIIIIIIIISFTAIFENNRVLLWSEGYNHDQKVAVNKQEQKIKCRK